MIVKRCREIERERERVWGREGGDKKEIYTHIKRDDVY